jgi:hypothetical protein
MPEYLQADLAKLLLHHDFFWAGRAPLTTDDRRDVGPHRVRSMDCPDPN